MSANKGNRGSKKDDQPDQQPTNGTTKTWHSGAYGERVGEAQQQPLQQHQPPQQQNLLSPPLNNPMPVNNNLLSPVGFAAAGNNYRVTHVSQPYSPPPSPVNSASAGPSPVPPIPSGPEQTADPDWQSSKNSVRERSAAMFNNDLMSDVTFVVGPTKATQQRIPAHRFVLATGSSVFYAMFYGGFSESEGEIEIPDVEPGAFLTLLRFLYSDDVLLEPDNILSTLYAAKKYLVPNLARACVEFLETSLTARNACVLLSQSRLFSEPDLMQRCWEVIDAQAELALSSDGFVEIDYKTLESIFSRETLNAKEVSIFNAAVKWASNECQRLEIEDNPENQRKVLKSILKLIRIPTMTLDEFANGPAQSGILSLQETTDIFLHFTAKERPNLEFEIRPRVGLKVHVCHRFQSSAYRSNQWRYRGRCDSINFLVDKRVFIVGFGLYGSSNGAADYNVKMELKRHGKTLAENQTKFFSDGSSNTFRVFFRHPIQIEADTLYTASAILDGSELSYFGQDGLSEVSCASVAFQFQCSTDSTNGTGVQGGQLPELLFYGPSQP